MFGKISLGVLLPVLVPLVWCDPFVTTDDYYRMPKLFQYDDYDECFAITNVTDPAYCVVRSVIKPNGDSELWSFIQNFSSDALHMRHDHLDRGLCVERCQRLVSSLNDDELEQLYVEKFEINFPYIVDFGAFGNISNDRARYGRLMNICVNYQLNRTYGLKAYTEIEYCTRPMPADSPLLNWFYGITLTLILLVISSSVYDTIINEDRTDTHYISDPPQQTKLLLTSFSIRRNWCRLTKHSQNQLSDDFRFIHAIRFCSMVLIFFAHGANCVLQLNLMNPIDLERSKHSYGFITHINGDLLVQTFFMISGLFLSLHFLEQHGKSKRKMSWWVVPVVTLYRYTRLTPVYAYVLLLYLVWQPTMLDGPLWPRGVNTDQYYCKENWWLNLLYVNNYVKPDQPCIQHTWYLACDFQLYLFGIIVLVAITKYPKLQKLIFTLGALIAVIIPAYVIYTEKLDSILLDRMQNARFFNVYSKFYQLVYLPFHTNMVAFFGGLIVGVLYIRYRKEYSKGNRAWYIQLLWNFTVPLSYFLMISTRPLYNDYPKPSLWLAALNPLLQLTWLAVAICFIYGLLYNFYGPIKQFLNYQAFIPLGRLSYCAYMVHIFVLKYLLFGSKNPIHFDGPKLYSTLISTVVIAYSIALFLSLAVEFPASAIQKYMFMKQNEQLDKLKKNKYTETFQVNVPVKPLFEQKDLENTV
ncbi:nose resistant to fluoxetine protein 6-like [Uranotaenia lowii]|uniref:nose resistant to fluoxetine protein 6-like n=1 Tax=Uranotaenia lowii TaxID=190385 RepID=UPI0024792003|nr:nose resistant to fluoxetine protein 6-like [Uranotaenia lowii]